MPHSLGVNIADHGKEGLITGVVSCWGHLSGLGRRAINCAQLAFSFIHLFHLDLCPQVCSHSQVCVHHRYKPAPGDAKGEGEVAELQPSYWFQSFLCSAHQSKRLRLLEGKGKWLLLLGPLPSSAQGQQVQA